jgi:predicted ATPase
MIISRVILKNWRNFRSVNANLGRRVFLVGPNASGKSNFLDALRFLRDIARAGGGLQKAVSDRGGISKIRCLAARQDPNIELAVSLTGDNGSDSNIWKYSIGIKQETRGFRLPILAYEKVWKNELLVLERPNAEDRNDYLRLTQTHLEQINANFEFRDITRFFELIHYSHLVPQLLRHPEIFSLPSNKDDPFGGNFLENIATTPEKTRKARLNVIARALRIAVPQFEELLLTKDERGIPHLETNYMHWRQRGAKQSEEEFSDGTLRLIGFLWAMQKNDSLLLLEEPELSLHSGIVRRLPALISRIQKKKNKQVVISTHSADLLSDMGIGGEEVLMLSPSVEGTKVQRASEVKEVRDLLEAGFSIADAVIPRIEPADANQLNLFNV